MPGRSIFWTILITSCIIGSAKEAASQEGGVGSAGGKNSTRSTLAGVYTTEQANRGRDVYASSCSSCHTPESHNGAPFQNTWKGRTLWELFGYISYSMPKNEPGSLSLKEYSQVLAFLLRMNGFPAGREELRADSASLHSIRFETRNAQPDMKRER